MTTEEELKQALEDYRLAQMATCGAEAWAAEARRIEEDRRFNLEKLLKNTPNRMVS